MRRLTYILIPLVLLLIVGLVWTVDLIVLRPSSNKHSTATNANPAVVSVGEKPAMSLDAQRQQLAKQTAAMLTQARTIAARANFDAIVAQVEKGDVSSLPPSFLKQFRLVDQFRPKKIAGTGILAVLQLGSVLNNSLPANHAIALLDASAWKYVYVDDEGNNAYVPLSLYLGKSAAFSFEYVWINNTWSFVPYSLVDSINAANVAASGASNVSK